MKIPNELTLVIFGASGDLTIRKLIPALLELSKQGMQAKNFSVLGVGRTKMTDLEFRQKMEEGLKKYARQGSEDLLSDCDFCKHLFYQSIDTKSASDYEVLKTRISTLNTEDANILFYLATPPSMYGVITTNLKTVGLCEESSSWRRFIIEKPFGYDYESAVELNAQVLNNIKESQLYRIDHYLGKETVQNILVTRFGNAIYEPLWNRNYISHIEITSSETIGVENRGGYYDGSGALRDMLQNHLLQLVGLVAMEPPASADDRSIRNETLKVFQSLRPLDKDKISSSVIRGQYTPNGDKAGYREEVDVAADSRTETFVAMKFFIDNWRWRDVPFFIRTGKRMPTRVTEVVIHFKSAPHRIFQKHVSAQPDNQLIIRIQPDEGIVMKLGMKVPGSGFRVESVDMGFYYNSLDHDYIPTAYERLLHDCMLGDATLYQRGDAVETTWLFVDPIIKACESENPLPLYGYPAGSWGPIEADQLVVTENLGWHYPCKNLLNSDKYCEL